MLKAGKEAEEMEKLEEKIKVHPYTNSAQINVITHWPTGVQTLEAGLAKEEGCRKDLETQLAKLLAEKNELFIQLQNEKGNLGSTEEKLQKLNSQKNDLEKQVSVSGPAMSLYSGLLRNSQLKNMSAEHYPST